MEKERKERRSGRREKVIKETRCWKRSGNWEWECEGKGKKLKLEVEWHWKEKESVALNGIGRGRHGNGEAGNGWEVGTRWL